MPNELAAFHTPEYINFLATATPDNQEELNTQMIQFNMGEDCPVFDGLFDFCRLYAGASIEAAVKLNHGLCDVAINWSGGLHHAKKGEASGELLHELQALPCISSGTLATGVYILADPWHMLACNAAP